MLTQAVPAWRHSWRGQPYRSWRSLPGTGHRQLSRGPQQPEPLTDTGHISGGQLTSDPFRDGPHSDDAAHHADVRRYDGRLCERFWPMWWGCPPPSSLHFCSHSHSQNDVHNSQHTLVSCMPEALHLLFRALIVHLVMRRGHCRLLPARPELHG